MKLSAETFKRHIYTKLAPASEKPKAQYKSAHLSLTIIVNIGCTCTAENIRTCIFVPVSLISGRFKADCTKAISFE